MMRRLLKNILRSLLWLAMAALAAPGGAKKQPPPAPEASAAADMAAQEKDPQAPCPDAHTHSRPLTGNETAMARGLFGNLIDTTRLRLHFCAAAKPERPGVRADARHGKDIWFYREKTWAGDYALAATPPALTGLLAHELAHIVEQQNDMFRNETAAGADPCHKTYEYALDPARDFGLYCREQRAAIIAAYARRFIHPAQKDAPLTAQDALLARTVESYFPVAEDLRKTRLIY